MVFPRRVDASGLTMCDLNVHGGIERLLMGTAIPPMVCRGPNVHAKVQSVENGYKSGRGKCDAIQIRNRSVFQDMHEIVNLRLLEQGFKGRNEDTTYKCTQLFTMPRIPVKGMEELNPRGVLPMDMSQ